MKSVHYKHLKNIYLFRVTVHALENLVFGERTQLRKECGENIQSKYSQSDILVALHSTRIQIDANDETCSSSHKNTSETFKENKPPMLKTSQKLTERTSLTKATSKYLLSSLTSRRKEHILLHRIKGKRTSNMAMKIEVLHILNAGFTEEKKLLQIHLNFTIL